MNFPYWTDDDLRRAIRIRKTRLAEAERELARAQSAVKDVEDELDRRQANRSVFRYKSAATAQGQGSK